MKNEIGIYGVFFELVFNVIYEDIAFQDYESVGKLTLHGHLQIIQRKKKKKSTSVRNIKININF